MLRYERISVIPEKVLNRAALVKERAGDYFPQFRRPWSDALNPKKILKPRKILRVVAPIAAAAIFLTACGPSAAPTPNYPITASSTSGEKVLAINESPYVTGAGHPSYSWDTRDGFDVAPTAVINCPPTERKSLDFPLVVASASGIVSRVGDMANRSDPYHSVAEITSDAGFIAGLMHLDQIMVNKGQQVEAGKTPIGKMSCEKPKGGADAGIHVHQYFLDKAGRPLPLNNQVVSGWTFQDGAKPYDGTVNKSGEPTRTADKRRCGPSAESIQACNGIRNDLFDSDKVTTKPAVPTKPAVAANQTMTPTVKPAPAEQSALPGSTRFRSTINPYQIDLPPGTQSGSYKKSDLFTLLSNVKTMSIFVEIKTEPTQSWSTLDDYKNKLSSGVPASDKPSMQWSPRTVDGRNGWKINVFYPEIPGYYQAVVFIDKNLLWYIDMLDNTSRTPDTNYDNQMFEAMIASLKLLK